MAKSNDGSDSFPHDLWLIKILHISTVPKIIRRNTLIRSTCNLVPIAVQMGFNSRIKGDVDGRDLPFHSVVCIDQPQPCPVVAVSFDVFAAQNRSYQIRGAPMLFLGLAIGKDFIALSGAADKGIVTAGFDAVVDLDIPIF